MRAVAMCFPLLQVPRCRIRTFASFWWENFHDISRSGGNSNFRLHGSKMYGLEGGPSRRWTRRSLSTRTGGNKKIISSKTSNISQQILDETISRRTKLNTSRVEISECRSIQHCDIEQNISKTRDLAKLITVIVFDIETTGLSRESERIIEIALQDLSGGVNSTFQTLVNPERFVSNPHVHGIYSRMVNRSEVPRMKDLIPILLRYIRSRQKPGGQILLIAHNGRAFDVPFLINEFSRCSFDIPPDWLFMDTMPLARELMKSEGSKLSSKSLQALREYYNIPVIGKAHRAMADVNVLALVLQKMTRDLKLTIPSLLENYTFTAAESSSNSKKKKNSK